MHTIFFKGKYRYRITKTSVAEKKLEMSMIKCLGPVAPSSIFFVDEDPQSERYAEQYRQQGSSGVTCFDIKQEINYLIYLI